MKTTEVEMIRQFDATCKRLADLFDKNERLYFAIETEKFREVKTRAFCYKLTAKTYQKISLDFFQTLGTIRVAVLNERFITKLAYSFDGEVFSENDGTVIIIQIRMTKE